MSASSKKKLRKEQAAANMTQKQQAAKKEAKKLKIYTATFWIVLALCVSLMAGIVLKAPITNLSARLTTALKVGDHKVSAVELNYFYIDAITEYYNQNSSYISYFKWMDLSKPLNEQKLDPKESKTWADNFVELAINNAKTNYALYDAAKAAGHKLTDAEQSSLDALFDNMKNSATVQGYESVNDFLESIYGPGANEKTYRKYTEVTLMASSYYNAYKEQLKNSYDEADLRNFEKDKIKDYNTYSYATHYLTVDSFKTGGTKDDKGNITYSDEEIKAAEEAAKKAADELGVPANGSLEALNAAIEALEKRLEAEKEAAKKEEEDKKDEDKSESTDKPEEDKTDSTDKKEDDKSESTDKKDENKTESTDKKDENKTYSKAKEQEQRYTALSATFKDWVSDDSRKAGDITVIPYETETEKDGEKVKSVKGYYVVLFQECEDNSFALANVRHILIAFEGGKYNSTTGQTTYTDAEKEAAHEKAKRIWDDFDIRSGKDSDKHEDLFAELANKYSTDPGSNTKGGLYEDIYPGQMVKAFEEFCFAEGRKHGDVELVMTEYGYHLMYYVGESDTTYRDFLIAADLLNQEMTDWQTKLNNSITVVEKNTKRVERDLILNDLLMGNHRH